jgi:tetratricopeptide (TPR) repeat protein
MKKFGVMIMLGFAVLAVLRAYGQEGGENPAIPYIQNGDRLFEAKKYKEAVAEYQKALAIDPNNQYAKFQAEQIQYRTPDRLPDTIPVRDYSKINFTLGPTYTDPSGNFSIRYPAGWQVDSADPNFNVKFTEPYSEVFIFIKVLPSPEPVLVNFQFRDQVEDQVKKLMPQIPGASLKYCNFDKFQNDTSLRTEIFFKAGPNRSIITTRYISDVSRILMVSWVCQEKLYYTFRPWAEAAISTLNLHPR